MRPPTAPGSRSEASATRWAARSTNRRCSQANGDMKIFSEEHSARSPRCSVQDRDEVIELANRTESASRRISTRATSTNLARRRSARIRDGGVNTGLITTEWHPSAASSSRDRTRRLEVRHRRVSRGEIRLHGRHLNGMAPHECHRVIKARAGARSQFHDAASPLSRLRFDSALDVLRRAALRMRRTVVPRHVPRGTRGRRHRTRVWPRPWPTAISLPSNRFCR